MPIRVGTVVNITNAYSSYQNKIKDLNKKKEVATTLQEKQKYDNMIQTTEMEVNEFLQSIIPDPEPSKVSPYLAKGYDSLYSNGAKQLDVEA